jgi:hypothetical protein
LRETQTWGSRPRLYDIAASRLKEMRPLERIRARRGATRRGKTEQSGRSDQNQRFVSLAVPAASGGGARLRTTSVIGHTQASQVQMENDLPTLVLMPGLDGTGSLFERFACALPPNIRTRIIKRRFPRPGKQSIFPGSEAPIPRGFGHFRSWIIDRLSGPERLDRESIYSCSFMNP